MLYGPDSPGSPKPSQVSYRRLLALVGRCRRRGALHSALFLRVSLGALALGVATGTSRVEEKHVYVCETRRSEWGATKGQSNSQRPLPTLQSGASNRPAPPEGRRRREQTALTDEGGADAGPLWNTEGTLVGTIGSAKSVNAQASVLVGALSAAQRGVVKQTFRRRSPARA